MSEENDRRPVYYRVSRSQLKKRSLFQQNSKQRHLEGERTATAATPPVATPPVIVLGGISQFTRTPSRASAVPIDGVIATSRPSSSSAAPSSSSSSSIKHHQPDDSNDNDGDINTHGSASAFWTDPQSGHRNPRVAADFTTAGEYKMKWPQKRAQIVDFDDYADIKLDVYQPGQPGSPGMIVFDQDRIPIMAAGGNGGSNGRVLIGIHINLRCILQDAQRDSQSCHPNDSFALQISVGNSAPGQKDAHYQLFSQFNADYTAEGITTSMAASAMPVLLPLVLSQSDLSPHLSDGALPGHQGPERHKSQSASAHSRLPIHSLPSRSDVSILCNDRVVWNLHEYLESSGVPSRYPMDRLTQQLNRMVKDCKRTELSFGKEVSRGRWPKTTDVLMYWRNYMTDLPVGSASALRCILNPMDAAERDIQQAKKNDDWRSVSRGLCVSSQFWQSELFWLTQNALNALNAQPNLRSDHQAAWNYKMDCPFLGPAPMPAPPLTILCGAQVDSSAGNIPLQRKFKLQPSANGDGGSCTSASSRSHSAFFNVMEPKTGRCGSSSIGAIVEHLHRSDDFDSERDETMPIKRGDLFHPSAVYRVLTRGTMSFWRGSPGSDDLATDLPGQLEKSLDFAGDFPVQRGTAMYKSICKTKPPLVWAMGGKGCSGVHHTTSGLEFGRGGDGARVHYPYVDVGESQSGSAGRVRVTWTL